MMFDKKDPDFFIETNESKIQELAIEIEGLDRKVDELLEELNVSSEQLEIFMSNKDNFTEENWDDIRRLRIELDEKIKRELANIRDPNKVKKVYKERNVSPHWLFVR